MSASIRVSLFVWTVAATAALSPLREASGQVTDADFPSVILNPQNDSFPFGAPRIRYQQWFSAREWLAAVGEPIRVNEMWFRAGSMAGQPARAVEFQIAMGNASPVQPSSVFDSNFVSGRVVTYTRKSLMLPASSPGTFPIRIPFDNEFVWDGSSGVVFEVKVWQNGNNNTSINRYELERAVTLSGALTRLYTVGNPDSTIAAFSQQRTGLTTRFFFREALTWDFGSGCPGRGVLTPVAGTRGGLPMPGNASWTQTIDNVSAQLNATFAIGGSDSMWSSTMQPLPFDLGVLGATGCRLLVDPVAYASVPTTGGGAPGAGRASFVLSVPPFAQLAGVKFYSQWLVLDPQAPNGLLAATQGLTHRVGLN